MGEWGAYSGLFFAALGAGSLLPLQSEAVLVGLLLAGNQPAAALVTVAAAGNILGSTVNWWLGRRLQHYQDRRWFPVGPAALARAQQWYLRYGKWSLLLSWVPVIGDPLTLVAGVLREPLPGFLLLVGLAKTLRYVVLAALTLGWAG